MGWPLLSFLFGLAVLLAGGEMLVRSSSRLASELGVSRLFIGLTVVAFGTSAPEAVVSVVAAFKGASDLALGNIVGSNIFNVLFILGASALILPLMVSTQLVRFDIPMLVGISFLVLFFGRDGTVGRGEGLFFLALLVVHMAVGYRLGKLAGVGDPKAKVRPVPEAPAGLPRRLVRIKGRWLNVSLVLFSLVLLVVGSRLLVETASTLARWLGLSELVIGLTIVAAGTSLPEVATSVMAAWRGERDIAVGNVIGSNIFNILGVLGISSLLAPGGITVPPSVGGFDLPVMVAVAVLCLPVCLSGMTIYRWEGGLLLGYFVMYTVYILLQASEHPAFGGFSALIRWIVLPASLLPLVVVTAVQAFRKARARKRPL